MVFPPLNWRLLLSCCLRLLFSAFTSSLLSASPRLLLSLEAYQQMTSDLDAIEQCAVHLRDLQTLSTPRGSLRQSGDTSSQQNFDHHRIHTCLFFLNTKRTHCERESNETISPRCKRSWRQRYCEGWRACATANCVAASMILTINIIITSWAANQHPASKGVGVPFSGDCKRAKLLNTWLQLIVNLLSSTLLAASNFCMQCLTSPTRSELDKAHSRGRSLDIGLSSMQNITAIGKKRRLLWIGLALSAMPLHLNTGIYNTTYFDSIGSHNPYNLAQIVENAKSIRDMLQRTGDAEELEPLACLQAYKSQYMSAWGDVLVVQSETVSPPLVYTRGSGFDNTASDTGYTENEVRS